MEGDERGFLPLGPMGTYCFNFSLVAGVKSHRIGEVGKPHQAHRCNGYWAQHQVDHIFYFTHHIVSTVNLG